MICTINGKKMITFKDRENSIRDYFAKLIEQGESTTAIANHFGVAIRTIKEFIYYFDKEGNKKQRSLSAQNYNIIVNKLKTLPIIVKKIDNFEGLITLLGGVSNIKWDFSINFDNEEHYKGVEKFRDFIEKDALIEGYEETSLLDIINLSELSNKKNKSIPQDTFMRYQNLKSAKEVFDRDFENMYIWGSEYYSFLFSGDQKEIFIFVSSDENHKQMSEIKLENKTKGIFSPKQKVS